MTKWLMVFGVFVYVADLPAQIIGGQSPGDPVVQFLNEVNIEYDRVNNRVVCRRVNEPCHYRIVFPPRTNGQSDTPFVFEAWADTVIYHAETQSATAIGNIKVDTGEYLLLTEQAHLIRSASTIIIPSTVAWFQRLPQDRFNVLKGIGAEVTFNQAGVDKVRVDGLYESRFHVTRQRAGDLMQTFWERYAEN